MKISSQAFKELFTPELEHLSRIFREKNYELRIAGGAVRDLLMGLKPVDVDFASTATPIEMKTLFEEHGVRMLHKKGEEHGTITCRINEKENFEITTLRIDVVCDGRRAEVKFTKDWSLDAFRRDLTVNSLFLDLDGTVHDYTGGIDDIQKRRIKFVGDPIQRLQEDYLRILRYFRFFGRIALEPHSHCAENIEAIIKCREGLKNVSGERIWTEFGKILVGRFAADVIDEMLGKCGLAPYLGLDGFGDASKSGAQNLKDDASGADAAATQDASIVDAAARIAEFRRVAAANVAPAEVGGKLTCEPSTVLAALLANATEADVFRHRVKFSNAEFSLCEFIVAQRAEAARNRDNVEHFKYLLLDLVFQNGSETREQARKQCVELLKYIDARECRRVIEAWEIPAFPVNGLALMEHGVPKGPTMRAVLKHLFELWKKSELQLTPDKLLAHTEDAEVKEIAASWERLRGAPKMKRRKVN